MVGGGEEEEEEAEAGSIALHPLLCADVTRSCDALL